MADQTLKAELVTPAKIVYSTDQATLVSLPATLGRVGILPGHTPFVSTLEKGKMHLLLPGGREIQMTVSAGFLQVKDNHVIVLAEEAAVL